MRLDEAERILGLLRPYDAGAVSRAFRTAAKRLHPDRGGEEEEFKRAGEAKELLLRHLQELEKARVQASSAASSHPPPGRPAPGGWPWPPTGTGSRTRARPVEDLGDDPFGLGEVVGEKLSVLHLEIDGRTHPYPRGFRGWVTAGGRDRSHLVVTLEPPSPIRVVGAVEIVVVFDGDEVGDALFLGGKVVGRSLDADNMVTRFRVDAFGR